MGRLLRSPKGLAVAVLVLLLFVIGFAGGSCGSKFIPLPGLTFLSVPMTTPELPAETLAHVGPLAITNTILTTWISMLLLVLFFFAGARRTSLVPKGIQNLCEVIIEAMANFVEGIAGKENGRRFFPIVATIFLFVIVNAWTSLIPGFGTITVQEAADKAVPLLRGANTDINTPAAIAVISFIMVEYWGIRYVGFSKYMSKFVNVGRLLSALKQLFTGKVKAGAIGLFYGAIDIYVGILETVTELARMMSFTFRLFGNMLAGEILLLVMMFLVTFIVAVPFYGLELLVGLIQSVVFSVLTLIFAVIAVSAHGSEH